MPLKERAHRFDRSNDRADRGGGVAAAENQLSSWQKRNGQPMGGSVADGTIDREILPLFWQMRASVPRDAPSEKIDTVYESVRGELIWNANYEGGVSYIDTSETDVTD